MTEFVSKYGCFVPSRVDEQLSAVLLPNFGLVSQIELPVRQKEIVNRVMRLSNACIPKLVTSRNYWFANQNRSRSPQKKNKFSQEAKEFR